MSNSYLNTLDFRLPDFMRVAYVSARAQQVWGPRIERIIGAYTEITWRSVAAGVRRCALMTLSPGQLSQSWPDFAREGLSAFPLGQLPRSRYSYANSSGKVESGQPYMFRVVVAKLEDAVAFRKASDESERAEVASLLGYPVCCAEAFQSWWYEQRLIDTTWPAAEKSAPEEVAARTYEIHGDVEANVLLRWVGVRAVPHLPCSFNCLAAVEFGRTLLDVGRRLGFDEEVDLILEMLSWPVEWSALHGIAEIKTPILKVSANTDATAEKYVVRLLGTSYPPEGATGLSFPYQQPPTLRLSSSRAFLKGLENPT